MQVAAVQYAADGSTGYQDVFGNFNLGRDL
jgi:hypothetical protein